MESLDIAYYLLAFAADKGDYLTNKKLQKLVYYVQAWSLAHFDDPIFQEEPQAWRHGPVYTKVYHTFKKAKYDPIPFEWLFNQFGLAPDKLMEKIAGDASLRKETQELIGEVMVKYGSLSAFQLEVLSHREKPWLDQRVGLTDFDRGEKSIPFPSMREYYGSMLVA